MKTLTHLDALEALDELESSAIGDEPFNHHAAPLVRAYIEQELGKAVDFTNGRIEGLREAKKLAEGWPCEAAGDNYQTCGSGSFWDVGTVYDQARVDVASAIDALIRQGPAAQGYVNWNKKIDQVCLTAVELRSTRNDDKAQAVIDKIREILESIVPPSSAAAPYLLEALIYYRDECTGAEPSLSIFHRMLDAAVARANKA